MLSEAMKAEGWIELSDNLNLYERTKARVMFADGRISHRAYSARSFRGCHKAEGILQIIAYNPEATHD